MRDNPGQTPDQDRPGTLPEGSGTPIPGHAEGAGQPSSGPLILYVAAPGSASRRGGEDLIDELAVLSALAICFYLGYRFAGGR